MTEEEIIERQGSQKSLEDALAELRFMCAAYKVVIVQRDLAMKNEKELQKRVTRLKETLASFTGGKVVE